MTFHVNHPLLYVLAAVVILFVLGQSCFFLYQAWRRARELGFSQQRLRRLALGSALFSIAPALAILLGLFSLSNFLGLPLPWLRLSVLGALTYELPAATAAARAMAVSEALTVTDPKVYATICWVMTLGILSGILIILFFQKKMQQGLGRMKTRDERWSRIFMDALFMGMIAAFLGMIFTDFGPGLAGKLPLLVMLVSALTMLLCGFLIRKCQQRWLENYAMPFSMLTAMLFAVLCSRYLF